MRVLDLFCKAGGAASGYARAGCEVVGVDIEPQPRFPFEFVQADVLALDPDWIASFDFIHASPPCQAHSALRVLPHVAAKGHADLIEPVRRMLQASGRPYVLENVVGAPVQGVTLCGTMFGLGVSGAQLRRHRLFETSWFVFGSPPCRHVEGPVIGIYGKGCENRTRSGPGRARNFSIAEGRLAMGCEWMNQEELSNAIPPAFTEWLIRNFLGMEAAR